MAILLVEEEEKRKPYGERGGRKVKVSVGSTTRKEFRQPVLV